MSAARPRPWNWPDPTIDARHSVVALRFKARELYEAAYALECDWDSRRTPHRQERLDNAVAEIRKHLEAVDA